MPSTYRSVRIYLSKFYAKILDELQEETGESQSAIFKIALVSYNDSIKKEKVKNNDRNK